MIGDDATTKTTEIMNHKIFDDYPELKPQHMSLTILRPILDKALAMKEDSEHQADLVKLVNHIAYLEYWLNVLYKKETGKDFDGHAVDCAFCMFHD